jgi:hypothetical protein
MNDFSELENELRTLRPARSSPVLFERIEEAMAKDYRRSTATDARWNWRRFKEAPRRFGIGLAAAAVAVLLLLVRINTNQTPHEREKIAQISPSTETRPVLPAWSGRRDIEGSTSSNKFVPAGATQVVYNERDEGLQFADGSRQPLRRLRYQTHQTWQWRNPTTGASLRVSYPSEEVILIPVAGQ